MTEVGIFLFGHGMNPYQIDTYGWQLHQLHTKKAPFSFFFTGRTLEAMKKNELVREKIREMFPENVSAKNPYDSEIGVSSWNHFPVVPLDLELESWGIYLESFVNKEIENSKRILWYDYGKNARGFFPPELLFAKAAGYYLRRHWIDYAIVDGSMLNPWEKGQVFHSPDGLKLVPRHNWIRTLGHPQETVNDILNFTHNCGAKSIVLGYDFDYNNYGIPYYQGVAYHCKLADILYRTGGIELRNIASIADSASTIPYPMDHHYTTSWIDCEKGLTFLCHPKVNKRNGIVNDVIRNYGRLKTRLEAVKVRIENERLGENIQEWYRNISNDLENARISFCSFAGGMEYRHPVWVNEESMSRTFYGTTSYSMENLGNIDQSLHGLEQHVFH